MCRPVEELCEVYEGYRTEDKCENVRIRLILCILHLLNGGHYVVSGILLSSALCAKVAMLYLFPE